MDKEGQIYLTVKISVVEANRDIDIATMTLKSIQKQNNNNEDAKNNDGTSSSEDERDGAELRENFNHFYTVLKDKGIQNEQPQDLGEAMKNDDNQESKKGNEDEKKKNKATDLLTGGVKNLMNIAQHGV